MCLLLMGYPGFAKPKADPLAETRAKLDSLQVCLGPADALALLRKGLLWGWKKPGGPPSLLDAPKPPPPPPQYLKSLDRDLEACAVASRIQDQDRRRLVLSAVTKDIQIKAMDCRKFGMGRMVAVRISTMRGDKAENGWQAFYKWSCPPPLDPEELRVPNLTSPASVELAPGVYFVRAEKSISHLPVQSIAPVTVVVGSVESLPLQLAIQ